MVEFDYKEEYSGEKKCHGVIAEEMADLFPKAICEIVEPSTVDDTSWMGVDYNTFIPYLIKMCQVQQQEINELKERLDNLEQ